MPKFLNALRPTRFVPSTGLVLAPALTSALAVVLALVAGVLLTLTAPRAARADDTFLDPSVAFRYSVSEQPGEVDVHYAIADGYYMYRERFSFVVSKGTATLGTPVFPQAIVKYDENFNKNVEIYHGDLTVRIPVVQAAGPFDLTVTGQGCAEKGICYPPQPHVAHIDGAALHAGTSSSLANAAGATAPMADTAPPVGGARVTPVTATGTIVSDLPPVDAGAASSASSTATRSAAAMPQPAPSAAGAADALYSEGYAQHVFEGHSLPVVLGIFFVLGMALSLLPCSLPMIPIVSAIVLGEGTHLNRSRGFLLSLSYVLGMAVVYTVFGVAAALLGHGVSAWLQNPWVLGVFAVLMVIFALSMFGAYELQLPQAWQGHVDALSQQRSGGKLAAVFLMGAISALVVGACMTAPLFGVLAFIAHTGSIAFGAAALFAMALGLGVPLVIVGVGAGTLLPRAGAWMEGVKRCFGVLLLAVALWMVSPILSPTLIMLLWALWLVMGALTLNPFAALPQGGPVYAWRLFGRALGVTMTLLAAIVLVGAAAGSQDVLKPLAVFAGGSGAAGGLGVAAASAEPDFGRVASVAQLDQALQSGGKPAMLDFYADWCTSCKEMERLTFTDPRVRARLSQLNLVRADVTDNGPDAQALLKRFSLFGPPAIILFDAQGHEVGRVVGEQPADTFLRSLDQAFGRA